jgi:CheY-like chemotaxis protein
MTTPKKRRPPAQTRRARGPSDGAASAPLVLVVDDFADGREIAADTLSFAGFRVAEAVDGHQALEKARALHPEVILMDLALPGIGGLEVVRRLKKDKPTRSIQILALTAHALESHASEARAAGCDGFMTKPCAPKQLVAEVRRALAARSPSRAR